MISVNHLVNKSSEVAGNGKRRFWSFTIREGLVDFRRSEIGKEQKPLHVGMKVNHNSKVPLLRLLRQQLNLWYTGTPEHKIQKGSARKSSAQ